VVPNRDLPKKRKGRKWSKTKLPSSKEKERATGRQLQQTFLVAHKFVLQMISAESGKKGEMFRCGSGLEERETDAEKTQNQTFSSNEARASP